MNRLTDFENKHGYQRGRVIEGGGTVWIGGLGMANAHFVYGMGDEWYLLYSTGKSTQ